jgi:hypothetical protein
MGRSQRRKVLTQWSGSSGALFEQGALSPAVVLDTGTYTPPVGPAGGSLKNSSLAGPAPVSVPIPTITSLNPNTAVIGGADLVMTVTGTNFLPNSTIFFNNGAERTTYISPTQVSTGVKPSLAGVAGAYPVEVSNIIHKSNSLDFTFTASGQQGALAPPAGERVFPMGPFSLERIEPSEDPPGVWYVLSADDGENLREGDEVLIEASTSSATNGPHTVTQLLTGADTRFFVPDIELAAPIESRGRLTINAGAE